MQAMSQALTDSDRAKFKQTVFLFVQEFLKFKNKNINFIGGSKKVPKLCDVHVNSRELGSW